MGRRGPGASEGHVQHHASSPPRTGASLRDETAQNRIINFTSVSGLHGAPGQPNYAAAKMGIVGLTYSCRQLAGQVRGDGECRLAGRGHPDDRLRADRAGAGSGRGRRRAVAGQRGTARRLPGQRAIRLDHRPDRALRRVRGLAVQQPAAGDPADRHRAVVAGRAGRAGRAVVPAGGRAGRRADPAGQDDDGQAGAGAHAGDAAVLGRLRRRRAARFSGARTAAKPYFYPRPVCPACGSATSSGSRPAARRRCTPT